MCLSTYNRLIDLLVDGDEHLLSRYHLPLSEEDTNRYRESDIDVKKYVSVKGNC